MDNYSAEIMVVDDTSANLKLLSSMLTSAGYTVRPAIEPQAAINAAKIRPPDLILLDIRMPEMDGYDVCRLLKKDKVTREIPILFVTVLHETNDKIKAFAAGGVDFITKPFQEAEVLARVKTHIELHRMQQNLEELVAQRTSELLKAYDDIRLDAERRRALLRLTQMEGASEQELADYALEEAVRLTCSSAGYFHFYDQDATDITLTSWSHNTMKMCNVDSGTHYHLEKAGIWADCVRLNKPVIHNDYANTSGRKGYPEGHFPVRRHMSVPVTINRRIIAIAGVGNKKEPYDESDVQQLTLLMTEVWRIISRKQMETSLRESENQLRQAQKMEAIGTLAGGIAHDFNNILSAIIGYGELLQDELFADDSAYEMLDQILQAGVRAKDLVRQILLFSRQADQNIKPIQPHLIIKEALKLLRSIFPSTIEIRHTISTSCDSILADPTQLHQIIMNLCTNAYHAMREAGGVLTISLSKIEISDKDIPFTELQLKPGRYLKLEIGDTGCGMDQATQEKIFNPYFTTKPKGEGTGLGLSVALGIIKSYGGHIKFYSEPEKGTSVHLYFPSLETEDEILKSETKQSLPTGGERILVVDDDELILNMTKRSLKGLGYEVFAHTSSLKALKLFQGEPDNFDLVITDMTMPHMTGLELAKQLFALRPKMPVILCTGFSELLTKEKAYASGIQEFLTKPILRADLAKTIRKVLDDEVSKES